MMKSVWNKEGFHTDIRMNPFRLEPFPNAATMKDLLFGNRGESILSLLKGR